MAERILSIFVDESGDFGAYECHAPYYFVTMVLHNQGVSIEDNIIGLEQHLAHLGYAQHTIHTGPIIRREMVYKNELVENRKRLFNAIFNFSRKLNVNYISVCVEKKVCPDVVSMTAQLSRRLAEVLRSRQNYFNEFDKINIYYDNGQIELTKILTSVFNSFFSNVEFRKVRPVDYKLFQVADLICTMELIA